MSDFIYVLIGISVIIVMLLCCSLVCGPNSDGVAVQSQENGLRNQQRRQDFNRFLSNDNRNFTRNSQRQQVFEAVQIDSLSHPGAETLRGNDCPPSYEDAMRQDHKISEKPPEYIELPLA